MARIAGVTLPAEKRIDIGLRAIYGIGRENVKKVLKEAKVDPAKKVSQLDREEVTRIQKVVEKSPHEGALRKIVSDNLARLKSTGAYRGIRHSRGLPVRGQRTRSNARTKRGKRVTIGALKKKDLAKVETAPGKAKEKE